MSSWASRAEVYFSLKAQDETSETTEISVLGVLGVPSGHPCKKQPVEYPTSNDAGPKGIKAQALPLGGASLDMVTVRPPGLSPFLLAASLALDASIVAAGTFHRNDPDAYCWPHSTAMNGAEIDLFTARLHRFTDKGLAPTDGEALADKLVIRDREADDRVVCLECRHLSGFGHTSWRCGNWQAADIAVRLRDTQLSADLVLQLQRCEGFTPYLTSTPQGKNDDHAQH